MRVVFDTNVVVAGLVAQGLCREIVEVHLPRHTPVVSPWMWTELTAKLEEKFDLQVEDLPVLHLYHRLAAWVEPPPLEVPACRDPDDDWVLATALAGRANLIVTGDSDLLTLRRFRAVHIVNPRAFLRRAASPG